MPKTKLTKKSLSNHFHYGKYVYVLLGIVAWMCADILYTTTEYRSPNERKVDVEMVASYVDTSDFEGVQQKALADGQAFERKTALELGLITEDEAFTPQLEEVNIYGISYSGEADDYYGAQKYMVMLAAQEGDIYFLNRAEMEELVASGVALSLDTYIEQGILRPGNRDLSRVTYDEWVEEGEPLTGRTHVYALQAEPLYGLLDRNGEMAYDARDKYMVITSYSKNPDTTAAVMQSLMDQFETEKPQWLIDMENGVTDNTAASDEAGTDGEGTDGDVSTAD